MVKRSPRRELPSLWFIEDFGVFSILGRKFLFHSFSGLGQSHRESELSDVRMVLPKYSVKGCCIPLLGVDSGSKLIVVFSMAWRYRKRYLCSSILGSSCFGVGVPLILTVPAIQLIKGFVWVNQGCPRIMVFLFPRSITKKRWREFLSSILRLRSI